MLKYCYIALALFLQITVFSQISSPTQISNLKLWLSGDQGVTETAGAVSQWTDQSGGGNNAVQTTASLRPIKTTSSLFNNKPVIRFDGTDDLLTGNTIPNLNTDNLTVFVISSGLSQTGNLSGLFTVNTVSTGLCLTRSFNTSQLFRGWVNNGTISTAANSIPATGYNPKILSFTRDIGVSSKIYLNGTLQATNVNSTFNSSFTNTNYQIGKVPIYSTLNGDIAEIIIYNRVLTSLEQTQVENYLMDKYAPPVSLGADINNTYGFCDIALAPSGYYTSYLWSTGATTSSININEPGTYSVQATDVFGRVTNDAIVVTRPHYATIALQNQLICYNNPQTITATIPSGDYQFVQWNDGLTTPSRLQSQAQSLNYTVKDNVNCTRTSNTAVITLDNSLQNVQLGNDTTLCEGNSIQLAQSSPSIVNYLWSTSATTSSIPVLTTGQYDLLVTNSNGCTKSDNINVVIQGQSPTILYTFPTQFCQNEVATFTESSFVQNGDPIGSRNWNFGNSTNSTLANGTFTNNVVGSYNGVLTVTSASGCQSTQTFSYTVRPKPLSSYTSPLLCDNVSAQFTNTSTAPSSTLSASEWFVDNLLTGSSSNLTYSHPSTGSYTLKLVVTNAFGCRDTSVQTQNVINTYPVPSAPNLSDPFNGKTVLSTEQIPFSWSSVSDNYFYELQLSTSNSFGSFLSNQTTTQTSQSVTLNSVGTVYWRVKSNNPCLLGGTSSVFTLNSIQVADSMRLWVRADRGVTLNGSTVSTWSDQSSNGLNATQSTVANQPTFVASNPILNGLPSVRFDGTNDLLNGGTVPRLNTNSISAFVVSSGGSQPTAANAVMLSAGSGWWMVRKASAGRYGAVNNGVGFQGATTTIPSSGYNFKLFGFNKTFGTSAQLKINGNSEITSTATGAINGFTAANYQIGGSLNASYLNGDVAEVMLFTKALTATEQSDIEKYLMDKYAKPVNLGADIVSNYGFCNITLNTNAFFQSYLWSTGATTSSIDVNEPGTYSVQATDIFGRVTSDAIVVTRPHYATIALQNQLICYNNPQTITATIPTGDYQFVQWNDGLTTPARVQSQGQSLNYTVKDNQNCTKTSNTALITLDNSLLNVQLGNDTTLCQGNNIQLAQTSPSIVGYLWNTGATTSSIPILTTGQYDLVITNSNGCTKSDNINVVIQGQSPTILYTFPTQFCQNEVATFTESSFVQNGELIGSRNWNFGNSTNSTLANGTFTNNVVGSYNGVLTVTSASGCQSTQTFSYIVRPKPLSSYTSPLLCDNVSAQFTNTSTAPSSSLNASEWFVDNVLTGSSTNLTYSHPSTGSYALKLVVTNAFGCRDTSVQTQNVINTYPIPSAPSLSDPFNGKTVLSTEQIPFSWSSISNNYFYELQFSTLSSFGSLLSTNSTTQTSQTLALNAAGTVYWRVKANNPCLQGGTSSVFTMNSIQVADSMRLWVRADRGVTLNGSTVSTWADQSSNGLNATQSTAANQPTFVASNPILNGLSSVRFDGTNDILNGGLIPGLNTNSLSVFVVSSGGSQPTAANAIMLSAGSGWWMVRKASAGRYGAVNNGVGFQGTTTTLPTSGYNFKLFGFDKILGASAQLKINGNNEITSTATGAINGFTAANYQIGGSLNASYLNGDVAEVMLFTKALTATEQSDIEKYLMDKYAKPVNLGADIVSNYGFCNITLNTNAFFQSYLWSTGATTSSIDINEPGTYSVQATDIFGRVTSDAIVVSRPHYASIALQNQTICYNNPQTIIATIPTGDYQFVQWNDGLTTPSRVQSQGQSLNYTVKDNVNCTRTSNTALITLDNSLENVRLGNDTSLCVGNTIQLAVSSPAITSYSWNTNESTPSIVLDTTGEYILEVSNANACIKTDAIQVTIIGESPTISYSFPSQFCQNEEAAYTESSFVPNGDLIGSRVWNFGNTTSSSQSSGTLSNNLTGTYNASLTVTSVVGCQSVQSFSYIVRPKPVSSYTSPLLCDNVNAQFTNTSTAPSSTLTSSEWFVDNVLTGSSTNLTYSHPSTGSYALKLVVTNAFGCRDTSVQTQNVINTYPVPSAPSLSEPFNGKTVLSTEQIPFSWSSVSDNYTYELQFSTTSSFGSLLSTHSTTQTSQTLALNAAGTVYWRVKANNPCLQGGTSSVFTLNSIQVADSMRLWVRADRGVTLNGSTVSTWADQSSNGLNATQSTAANQPTFVASNPILNGLSSVRFDGINDLLNGGLIPGLNTNSLSVFIVSSGGSQPTAANAVMLSAGNGWWLIRKASAGRYGAINSNYGFQGTTTTLPTTGYDFKLFGLNKVFGTSNQLKINGSTEITTNVAAGVNGFTNANYQIGAASGSNHLNGDVAEVMVFTKTLSATEQTGIEKYLMDKYAPPIKLGADIVSSYGFCDTTIVSTGYFTSYVWNTGETTSAISVNEPGTYSVIATDIFGRISKDTIIVSRPNYASVHLADRTVCYNAPIVESASLPSGDYHFMNWNDGDPNPDRLLTLNENLSYTVADNRNCLLTSNIALITIDNSLEQVRLGSDTSLCFGNSVQLLVTSPTITNYLWNSGNTNSSQVVTTNGDYSIEVRNLNNCIQRDTINVSIIGQAPSIVYNFPSAVCQSELFSFSEASTIVGSTISSRTWTINNTFNTDQSNGTSQLSQIGTIPVNLEVVAANGCRSLANFNVTVNAKPQVNFTTQNVCPYDGIAFNAANASNVNLASFDWNFGQSGSSSNTSSMIQPSHIYGVAGSFNVELRVIDVNGCKDTVNQTVVVQEAPIANFTIQNVCESNSVVINNTSSIGSNYTIDTYAWNYGDGTTAINPSIAKKFNQYGDYTVQLITIANNGCRDTVEQGVTVYPNPVLNWQVSPSCKSTLTTFESLSTIPEGSIVTTDWLVNLQYPFSGNVGAYRFATLGVQYLNLTTTSDQGCISDTLIIVNVNPELKANFTIDPALVVAGVPINFHDTSIGASSSTWDLALGLDPVTYSPPVPSVQATYLENYINDTIYIYLFTDNDFGCKDTMIKQVIVGEPRFDLSISNLFYEDNNGFNTVGVELHNNGSLAINKVDLILSSLNSLPIKETWTGNLEVGQTYIYIFNAQLSSYVSTQDQFENYLCVEGTATDNFNSQDLIASNNRVCENTESSSMVVMPIYPNPTSDITYGSLIVPVSDSITKINITLYSPNGEILKRLFEDQEVSPGIFDFEIDLSRFESGVYLLKVEDGTTTRVVRVSKF